MIKKYKITSPEIEKTDFSFILKSKIKEFCGLEVYEKIKVKRQKEILYIKFPPSDYIFYCVQTALFSIKKMYSRNCKIESLY